MTGLLFFQPRLVLPCHESELHGMHAQSASSPLRTLMQHITGSRDDEALLRDQACEWMIDASGVEGMQGWDLCSQSAHDRSGYFVLRFQYAQY